jgi:hypothetical protein
MPNEFSFRELLENLLLALLPEGYPDSTRMASLLDVSKRTLARRLAAEGTTYSVGKKGTYPYFSMRTASAVLFQSRF